MFPKSYFGSSYFAASYWPGGSIESSVTTILVIIKFTLPVGFTLFK